MSKNLSLRLTLGLAALAASAGLAANSDATNSVIGEGDFGAYYTKLTAGQGWEAYSRTGEYADIVARIPHAGGALVFWRGNSYLPYWKTHKGQWDLAELIPRSGDGTKPMPDRANSR